MKNKALIYLLITAVAAVWGIIFYRIFSTTQDEEMAFKPFTQSRRVNESLDDYTFKDTFTLALNYRDPFLGNLREPVKNQAVVNYSAERPASGNLKPPKPRVNWEVIKYTGFILNPASKRVVALMNINGKEYMLSEGQSASGLKLLKNLKDSVRVSYQDNIKYIRIQ